MIDNNKLSVLMFSTDYKPDGGGIAEHTYQMARHLHNHGCRMVVLSVKKMGCEEFDGNQLFKTYRVFNIWFLRNLLLFFYLLYLCRKEDIKCVYSTITHPCGELSYVGSFLLHYKTIISVHGYEVNYNGISWRGKLKKNLKWTRSHIYNHTDKVFVVSEYTKQKLIQSGVNQRQIQVYPNGVDMDEWVNVAKDEQLIERYNLNNKKIILTVGSLIPRKGHDIVIKAISRIKAKIPNVKYIIAGEGPNENYLKGLVRERRLEEYVIFLGRFPQQRLNQLYNTCDVFVMPNREDGSSVEGFGIVFLEANTCKKPVIGGNSGGTADAIVSGRTGFLVDPNNIKDLSGKIIELLANSDMAQRIGYQGYERIKNELTWDKIVSGIRLKIENIITKGYC